MDFTIETLAASDAERLAVVTRMCMATVLETIPEFRGEAEVARRSLPNFEFAPMQAMLARSAASPAHRILVAVEPGAGVVGYSIASVKVDGEGVRFGYLFSRGVAADHRRRGIASRLLEVAEAWFASEGVRYLQAESHVGNRALRRLLERHGFSVVATEAGAWPYHVFRKDR